MISVRRLGIALGSLVAAALAMGLVGGLFLSLFGLNTTTTAGQVQAAGGLIVTLVTLVLGGLIYRDIIRRERRPD
jgi:CBS domain containing-hemolysin-like protein